MTDWVGWDLDVGHGERSYLNRADALDDARRLRKTLHGRLEIRTSKSGKGLHLRHMLPEPSEESGAEIAKRLMRGVPLLACPAALGRQVHWLWDANAAPDGFELLEEHVCLTSEKK